MSISFLNRGRLSRGRYAEVSSRESLLHRLQYCFRRSLGVPALMRHQLGYLLLAVGFVSGLPLTAQWINYPTLGVPRTLDGKPNLSAACPRTPGGRPDLSGMWVLQAQRTGPANLPGCEPAAPEFMNIAASINGGLPYQTWAADLVSKRRAEQRINDPLSHCLPIGIIRLHTIPIYKKVVQVPGLLVLINEYNTSYRQIFTDGRPLPVDPNPSWNGYSSGKWEGDTLVVKSAGFRDGLWLDNTGNPLTEAATITERFRRPNFGNLEIEITVDDPKAYTKPWSVKLNQTIKLDSDLVDLICNETRRTLSTWLCSRETDATISADCPRFITQC